MVSTDMTLHVELMGQDRDLLERTCENLEWYRKHLQEMAQVQQVEQEALKSVRDVWGVPIKEGQIL